MQTKLVLSALFLSASAAAITPQDYETAEQHSDRSLVYNHYDLQPLQNSWRQQDAQDHDNETEEQALKSGFLLSFYGLIVFSLYRYAKNRKNGPKP